MALRSLALFTVLLAGQVPSAHAQERTVAFDEALALAVEADVVGRDLRLQGQAFDADIDAVRASRRPTLDVEVSPSQGYGLGFDPTTGQSATQGRTAVAVGGSGRLLLYDGGRARAQEAALAGARAALRPSTREAERRTAIVVAGRYTRVLVGQGLVALAEADLAAQLDQLDQVLTFVRAGVRPPSDTLAQRSSVAGARRTLAAERQALAVDRAVLARVLGLPATTSIVAVVPPARPMLPDGLADLRPDIAAADARVAAARLDVAAARRDRAPVVSLGAFVGTDFSSLQTRADAIGGTENVPLFAQLSSNRSAAAVATFTVPLVDGRATAAREARARVAVAQAELIAETARLDAEAEGVQSQAQVQGAVERLAAAEEQASLAEAYADVQRRRYDLAAGSLFEWADARDRYVAAAAAAEEARHLLWLARVEAELVGSWSAP